ncbi:MAG: rod shape-determining protein RodA [Planctomycetes bacterium]|nr:rod shape-determining protein RodA [Planctomycetota bacterium]
MDIPVWLRQCPWLLVASGGGLALLGVAAIARCEELASQAAGRHWHQQLLWAALGFLALLVASLPNYRRLNRLAYVIYAVAVALLVVVYFCPPVHGVHRWIRLGPLSLQPSELAKVAYVLALARFLSDARELRGWRALFAPLAMTVAPVWLVLREPDLGTSLVFIPALLAMLLVAGLRRRDLLVLMLCGAAMTPALWSQMSREQRSRITSLFQQSNPGERPKADGYQLHQAKQVLALGGVAGSWLHEAGDESLSYHLPEAHTDFIFAVIGERYGWPGLGSVVLLYLLLVGKLLAIARQTRDPFGRLLVTGVAALFGSQMLINTGMSLGLLPVTGLTLPLVSYGGSALVSHALALGLAVNVGLRSDIEIAPGPFSRALV